MGLDVGVFGCQGLLKLVAFFKIWMAVFGYRGIWTVWFSDLALEALFRTSGFLCWWLDLQESVFIFVQK